MVQGGSGYVMSAGLMKDTYGRDPHFERREEKAIANWCCGDAVLAIALFKDDHIRIKGPDEATSSGFNKDPPHAQSFNRRNWCDPLYTFHHVTETDISDLWHFEQEIWPKLLPNDNIRFVDAFSHFLPDFLRNATDAKEVVYEGWANLSSDLTISKRNGIDYNSQFCRQACDERSYCWAWSFGEDKCTITVESVKMGQLCVQHISDYRMDRIKAFRQTQAFEGRPMRKEAQ